jgi:DNA topoisomerase-1
MKGLSAKVFRTYNASHTFQEELKKTPADGTVAEKLLAYNRANRQVAILCNHQRSVPKTHSAAIEKLRDKVRALKLQRQQVKKEILELDPKKKKKIPELTEEESDLDDEWIAKYEEQQVETKKVKLEQVNEARAKEGEKPLKELPSPTKKGSASIEKLENQLKTLDEKIDAQKMAMVDKVRLLEHSVVEVHISDCFLGNRTKARLPLSGLPRSTTVGLRDVRLSNMRFNPN